MLTRGAIGNLINRYRAVLKKCHLINTFGSLAVASMLVMGGAGVAGASVANEVYLGKAYGSPSDDLGFKLEATKLKESVSLDGTEILFEINGVTERDIKETYHIDNDGSKGTLSKGISPVENPTLSTKSNVIVTPASGIYSEQDRAANEKVGYTQSIEITISKDDIDNNANTYRNQIRNAIKSEYGIENNIQNQFYENGNPKDTLKRDIVLQYYLSGDEGIEAGLQDGTTLTTQLLSSDTYMKSQGYKKVNIGSFWNPSYQWQLLDGTPADEAGQAVYDAYKESLNSQIIINRYNSLQADNRQNLETSVVNKAIEDAIDRIYYSNLATKNLLTGEETITITQKYSGGEYVALSGTSSVVGELKTDSTINSIDVYGSAGATGTLNVSGDVTVKYDPSTGDTANTDGGFINVSSGGILNNSGTLSAKVVQNNDNTQRAITETGGNITVSGTLNNYIADRDDQNNVTITSGTVHADKNLTVENGGTVWSRMR